MTEDVTQARRITLFRANRPTRVSKAGRITLYLPVEPPEQVDAPPVAFSLIPETPVEEVWEWKTALQTAVTGDEQRAVLRAAPRIRFKLNFKIENDADRQAYYAYLMRYYRGNFLFPVHAWWTQIRTPSAQGATRIYFDPNRTDVRAGEDIALYDPYLNVVTFGKTTAMQSDGANVEAMPVALGRHCQVMPALSFRFPEQAGFSMYTVSGELTAVIEAVPVRALRRPGVADQVTTISNLGDTLPLLDKRPLANDTVDEVFDQNIEWVDNEVSSPTFATQWRHPKITGQRTFKARRVGGLDYWREFFDRVKGRQKGFLVPTFRSDLTLKETAAPGDAAIHVSNLDYYDQMLFPTYRRLRIETAAGPIYRRVTARQYTYQGGVPAGVRIFLDAPLGLGVGEADIRMISFLNVCRMADDAIQITHRGLESYVTFGIATTDA